MTPEKEANWFVTVEDIAAVCNCDSGTVYYAMYSAGLERTRSDGNLCTMHRTGRPHDPKFYNFKSVHLWKWTRLPELKAIVDEYIRIHP